MFKKLRKENEKIRKNKKGKPKESKSNFPKN
jgi:hypothetical protein